MKGRVLVGGALLVMQLVCAVSKLASGVPYFIRLRGGREDCQQEQLQEHYLGFFNRTCGSLAPKSVGPWLRDPTKLTWRQWNITIIGETDREQWGYLQTYYPEEWGEARCVGHLGADPRACTGPDSEIATIDARSERTIFRFVPLSTEEGTYRIIVRSKNGKCNRFLTAFEDCSDASVGFSKEDYREGLQRWVITEAGPVASPTPSPTRSPIPLPTDTPLPTETPSPVPIPAPTVAVETSSITFTSGRVRVLFDSVVQAVTCTVWIKSSNQDDMRSITLDMPSNPQENMAVFNNLRPATEYEAFASCNVTGGRVSPESDRVALKTSGSPYDLIPSGPETFCDGLGEILDTNGKCTCDSENFIPNGKGGCKCKDDDLAYDAVLGRCRECNGFGEIVDDKGFCICGEGSCRCPNDLAYDAVLGRCRKCNGFGEIVDYKGSCVCDTTIPLVVPDGQGGCTCEDFMELQDGTCGCKANCPLTNSGICDCGSYVHFFPQLEDAGLGDLLFYYMIVGDSGATVNAVMPGTYDEQLTFAENGFNRSEVFNQSINADLLVPFTGEVSDRAIRLQYDQNDKINAFTVLYADYSSDMSLVVNGDQLGKEYLILSTPNNLDKNFFSVTAVDFDTSVQITPSVDLNTDPIKLANVPFEVALEKPGDTVLFYSRFVRDVSGTYISASKPVNVLAGNQCAEIPSGSVIACDISFSQMFPVNDFGTEFQVVESGRQNGDYIRVLAAEDGTQVFFDGVLEGTIDRGQLVVKDQVRNLVVTSDKPVLVGHYLRGGGDVGGYGDPSFTVIPSTEQWLTSYVYATVPPDTGDQYDNQINVVIADDAKDSLRLNGETLADPFNSEVKDGYFYANFAIDAGHGTISADVPFLALSMGLRMFNSYYTFLID